jgi:SAM-dependent methyltransferase
MSDPIPPNEPDSSQTQFWTRRWHKGKIPWDLGSVPADLVAFLERTSAPTTALIPGCGSGYEVRAFHGTDHDVTAIDFSATAVAHAKELLGPLGDKVVHGNFFRHDFADKRYGLIYERGFLCSLPQTKWPEYASRMADLLLPGGRLVGLFLYGQEPEPPPYPLTKESAKELFGKSFQLVHDDSVTAKSVPVYQGMEHWQEWRKIGD